MKKLLALLICAIMLSTFSIGIAEESIDAQYKPILEAWNAGNCSELWNNILKYWWEQNMSDSDEASDVPNWPLNIRFGGTTEQLISEQENWDLAIVSSKDIDLQKLADQGLIMDQGYVPSDYLAMSQWLYSEHVQSLFPSHPILMYEIYCYDYNIQMDDATLLICQADIGSKKNSPRSPDLCAQEILNRRDAEQVRAVEGIVRVNWMQHELLERPDEWDVATLTIETVNDMNELIQASLLYDFSDDSYWLSRDMDWPVSKGVFDADGKLIAIPYIPFLKYQPGPFRVIVVNASGLNISRALEYTKRLIKSYEWLYHYDTPIELRKKYGICIEKDRVDW